MFSFSLRGLLASCALVAVVITSPTIAQDAETPPPPPQSVWERNPQQPPNRNILFLIDSSGSMNGRKVNDAIAFAMQIAEAPVDEFNIALVTFGTRVTRWAGTEDVNPQNNTPVGHRGWSAMPSADNLAAAREWISNNLDGGSTYVVPGIQHAVRSNSNVVDPTLQGANLPAISLSELTIFIITDGDFTEPLLATVVNTITEMQALREQNDLPPVVFGLIGVNVSVKTNLEMRQLSEPFILGYLRLSYR